LKVKLLVGALAALFITAASAQGTGFITGDYIRSNGEPQTSQYEYHVGGAYKTPYGTFDGAYVGVQNINSTYDAKSGAEAGYSYTMNYQGVRFTGRAAAGAVSSDSYYTLGAEAGYKVDPAVELYTNYRFREGWGGAVQSQNRYGFGADVGLAKNVALRVGYTYTDKQYQGWNGFNSALMLAF
jgi:hypothetical protein